MNNWKVIVSSDSLEHLEMLKINLKENCDIDAVVINKKISAYQIGVGELLVLEQEVEEAKKFLEK
jgi:hypothetical protein